MKKKNIILISFVVLFLLSLVILSQIVRDHVENSSKRKSYIERLAGCGNYTLDGWSHDGQLEETILKDMDELGLSISETREKIYECKNNLAQSIEYYEKSGLIAEEEKQSRINFIKNERTDYINWLLNFLDSLEKK